MRAETVILHINESCNNNDLPKARSIIEHHWSMITESRHYLHLNINAQSLVKIIQAESEKNILNQLTFDEKRIIHQMNQYVRDLRYSHARKTYIKHKNLFDRPEIQNWLNIDAQILCDGFRLHT
ncbi:hypothetical protein [Bacillus sp. S/N-304-OC-R1]|uniref:hypothetical protein n=1 Tax=Bacillus sp. S/N-304-OC-R1 TaxID=2758034 RepID=UPI001C8EFE96|nr:hypothetical protein [Bacillus sp. S/N-304-OC-R1]MBY0120606.1 hypothetical protein [Bacillus sp. S/N-304-OC-R1]